MIWQELGWSSFFEAYFGEYAVKGCFPVRVVREDRECYLTVGVAGELPAAISGRFRHRALEAADFPAVGDWVALEPAPHGRAGVIHGVLPRRTVLSRREVAGPGQQVIVANVDVAFLVAGLDGVRNFNLQKLERYLTLAWDSGAEPVIVLNKTDLCEDVAACLDQAATVACGAAAHAVSAVAGTGIAYLREYLGQGRTGVFLGPSGVGKTSLINALLGDEQLPTHEIRQADHRGRHTTARRELIFLPGGGMIVDTPGIREVTMWADAETVETAFPDVEALAARCRFADCRHQREPGCAVLAAIADGRLPASRYESYLKLGREARRLSRRQREKSRLAERSGRRRRPRNGHGWEDDE